MDPDNLDFLYTRIVTGSTVLEFQDKIYIVKDPTPKEKRLADHWYEKCYDRFLFSAALTKEEVNEILLEKRLIDPGMVNNLEQIEDYIDDLKDKKTLSSQEKQELDLFNKKKKELERVKGSLSNKTAEYLATIEKYKYYVFLCSHDEYEQRIWKTHQEFLKEDERIVNHLLQKVYFEFDYHEKYLRKLARTEPWRSTWVTYCKGGGDLFGVPHSFMTDLQKSLVSWSIIYDGIYENPDRPPMNVIDDDKLCDEWLKNQSKENKTKNKVKNNSKINSSQEIFIMVNSQEEAKRVYEDNSFDSKNILKSREKKIMEKGVVKEGHLPDVQMDLKLRKNRLEMSKGKK